jgi:hypothetical protein
LLEAAPAEQHQNVLFKTLLLIFESDHELPDNEKAELCYTFAAFNELLNQVKEVEL